MIKFKIVALEYFIRIRILEYFISYILVNLFLFYAKGNFYSSKWTSEIPESVQWLNYLEKNWDHILGLGPSSRLSCFVNTAIEIHSTDAGSKSSKKNWKSIGVNYFQ